MLKRLTAAAISMMMLFSCFVPTAYAVEDTDVENANFSVAETAENEDLNAQSYTEGYFRYTVSDGKATITKYTGKQSNVTVPAKIGGYPVYAVANGTFYYNAAVKNITFSEGIALMDQGSIYVCSALQTINYPSTIIPDPVLEFFGIAFFPIGCRNLAEINFAENNKHYTSKNGAAYSKDLKTLYKMPSKNANANAVFEIADGVEIIAESAFEGCLNITKVVMPDTVKAMDRYAFYECNNLSEINISKNCEYIGQYAFDYTKIKSIHIPASVTAIAPPVFYGCQELEKVTVDKNNPKYYIQDGVLFHLTEENNNIRLDYYPNGRTEKEYYIPDNVQEIGWRAFDYAMNLEYIHIPQSVEIIWQNAFWECRNLKKMDIPGSVKEIYGTILANSELKEVYFWGDAPEFYEDPLSFISAKVYYPKGNKTWTADKMPTYDGRITWIPFNFTPQVKITLSNGKPKLTWGKVKDATSYKVYRSTSKTGTYKLIKTTKDTSFTNTNAEYGKTYFYKVTAVNEHGTSPYSKVVQATALAAPTNVKVTNDLATGKPKITWNKVEGAEKYQIWRSTTPNGTYGLMNTFIGTSMINKNAVAGKLYYYKIVAVDANGNRSEASEIVKRTSDLARPAVTVKIGTTGKPVLSWNKVEGATKYKIYRSRTGKAGSFALINTVTGTSTTNKNAVKGTKYFYKVVAVHSNTNANSAYSTVVSIISK